MEKLRFINTGTTRAAFQAAGFTDAGAFRARVAALREVHDALGRVEDALEAEAEARYDEDADAYTDDVGRACDAVAVDVFETASNLSEVIKELERIERALA